MDFLHLFQRFIGFDSTVHKYLHNTCYESIAQKVINEGFEFEKYLENTTDMVVSVDLVRLKYFWYLRESYGSITIIIQIGKEIEEDFTKKLEGTGRHFSEAIAIHSNRFGFDDEPIYILPRQFVKGYFNYKTGKSVQNPDFNPHYTNPQFLKNVERFLIVNTSLLIINH